MDSDVFISVSVLICGSWVPNLCHSHVDSFDSKGINCPSASTNSLPYDLLKLSCPKLIWTQSNSSSVCLTLSKATAVYRGSLPMEDLSFWSPVHSVCTTSHLLSSFPSFSVPLSSPSLQHLCLSTHQGYHLLHSCISSWGWPDRHSCPLTGLYTQASFIPVSVIYWDYGQMCT